jgi:hypothetical protein
VYYKLTFVLDEGVLLDFDLEKYALKIPCPYTGGACTVERGRPSQFSYRMYQTFTPPHVILYGDNVPSLLSLARFSIGEYRLEEVLNVELPELLGKVKYHFVGTDTDSQKQTYIVEA